MKKLLFKSAKAVILIVRDDVFIKKDTILQSSCSSRATNSNLRLFISGTLNRLDRLNYNVAPKHAKHAKLAVAKVWNTKTS